MYLVETITKKEAMVGSFMPAFDKQAVAEADKLEVWGSSFADGGEDFTEFRLIKAGTVICKKCMSGY